MLLATAPPSGCDLVNISGALAVHEALSRRAIEIVAAAGATGPRAEALLERLIDPSASFDLIIGDVGSPGTGVPGARAIAKSMKANEYRLLGWDYMDIPADPCGKQSIVVDFISSRDRLVSQVEFTFQQARLVTANGRLHSFTTGPLPSAPPDGKGS